MLQQLWYKKATFLTYCLLPFAWLFRLIITLRKLLYRCGIKKSTHFPATIIVVGNITVGGTGKTPLVIWLANLLLQQDYRPGIVSRGYGAKNITSPRLVTTISKVTEVGDEPLLIAHQVNCPIAVAPKRTQAIHLLLNKFNCNVIISDDGLQHYAIQRDIEIAVIDAQRQFGNGHLLPAGPLREPMTRLNTVDFIIYNEQNPISLSQQYNNKNLKHHKMYLKPKPFLKSVSNPTQQINITELSKKTIHAVAGIGNPQRFFTTLRQLGLTITEHPFPDHHVFKSTDINFGAQKIVIMTAKDAVKCSCFADERHWFLPVKAELNKEFTHTILRKLAKQFKKAKN
jgi:tetraacyldisaccharide 4'-kinase